MDNYYDHALGRWVTYWDRFDAVAAELRFRELREYTVIFDKPERAWQLILDLLASVPEDTIHYVGAGDLETFIGLHGTAFVDELEMAAQSNARFREAVLEVNLERGRLPADIEQRLVVAFGPRFSLLPPVDER